MKVSEVKKKIDGLKSDHDNMVRLRDLLDDTGFWDETQKKLEDDAGLTCFLCDLITNAAETLRGEIERLEKIIDDADAQI